MPYLFVENGIPKKQIVDTIHQVSDDVTACRIGSAVTSSSQSEEVKGDLQEKCSVSTVVFIAKMVPVRIADLSPRDAEKAIRSVRSAREKASKGGVGNGDDEGKPANVYDHTVENINNTEVFLALGRVFSGTLTADSSDSVYCLGNHHNPFEHAYAPEETQVEGGEGEGRDATRGISTQRVPLSALSFYMCLGPGGKAGILL